MAAAKSKAKRKPVVHIVHVEPKVHAALKTLKRKMGATSLCEVVEKLIAGQKPA